MKKSKNRVLFLLSMTVYLLLSFLFLSYCSEVQVSPRDLGPFMDDGASRDISNSEDTPITSDDGIQTDIVVNIYPDNINFTDDAVPDDIGVADDVSIKDTAYTDTGYDTGHFDAGRCPQTLKERISVRKIDISPDSVNNVGGLYFSPYTPPIIKTFKDDYLLAYLAHGGKVRILKLNQNLSIDGIKPELEANELRGLAASENGFAVMVQRGTDEMALVGFNEGGTKKFDTTIIGNVDHGETWAKYIKREWGDYGTMGFYNNQYVVYFGHSMNWGESGEHQGDLLWFFDTEGNKAGGMWDWGCSHSLDVRLAFNSQKMGAVCLSDCYPQKAICFNHREAVIHNDPSGNCGGYSNANLGGFVAFEDGFYHTFLSSEGRSSKDIAFVKINNNSQVSPPVWITDTPDIQESNTQLAKYGENLLVTYKVNDIVRIGLIDKSGNIIKPFEDVADVNFYEQTIFENNQSGDTFWAFGEVSNISVYMVRYCD